MGKLGKWKRFGVEEVTFDRDSRIEYLTGFHKRKLQRRKHALEEAEKRAKAEKIEERRKIRESRKDELQKHVEAVEAAIGTLNRNKSSELGESSEAEGYEDERVDQAATDVQNDISHIDEFVDENLHATVTIEPIDLHKSSEELETKEKGDKVSRVQKGGAEKPKKAFPKKEKKKKFRYLSKADRKETRRRDAIGRKARSEKFKELRMKARKKMI